jgi:predicted nucleic acid-binding protein
MVLGTAKAADVSYLVTGDKDLLELESYEGFEIVTPRQFWDAQSKEESK